MSFGTDFPFEKSFALRQYFLGTTAQPIFCYHFNHGQKLPPQFRKIVCLVRLTVRIVCVKFCKIPTKQWGFSCFLYFLHFCLILLNFARSCQILPYFSMFYYQKYYFLLSKVLSKTLSKTLSKNAPKRCAFMDLPICGKTILK